VVQTPVVQIPVVKTQVKVQSQVPTLEDEILAIEQIGLGFITNKINENITLPSVTPAFQPSLVSLVLMLIPVIFSFILFVIKPKPICSIARISS
jgi:hypothetical protein